MNLQLCQWLHLQVWQCPAWGLQLSQCQRQQSCLGSQQQVGQSQNPQPVQHLMMALQLCQCLSLQQTLARWLRHGR